MPHDASALGPGARPAGPARPEIGSVAISDITGNKEQSLFDRLFSSQAFWVTIAVVIICVVMTMLQPESFASTANFYNITRNFAFIGMMAIGMTAVIITGGIDLSVGSVMGLVGVVSGLLLQADHSWYVAILGGLATGVLAGAINGALIAYLGLSSFVVTLGMLSFARIARRGHVAEPVIYKLARWARCQGARRGAMLGNRQPRLVLVA
jgi:ribose transport system permease protein